MANCGWAPQSGSRRVRFQSAWRPVVAGKSTGIALHSGLCALSLLVAGCGYGAAPTSTAPGATGVPPLVGAPQAPQHVQSRILPLVDHHQHLLSPAGAELVNRRPLPAVELPEDLAHLLREREQRWNDSAAIADLYTMESLALGPDSPGWTLGRSSVAGLLSARFARAYYLTPVFYRMSGSAGRIAGYYTRGSGDSRRHFGYFYIDLDRGRDRVWRIVAEIPTFPGPVIEEPVTGEYLVSLLDTAGIRRAVVLSDAYYFDSPLVDVADAYAQVRAENDWTAQQVARFPDRLVAFCSFNPLQEYALAELDRCAANPHFRGLKLHFGGSGVSLKNPEHVEKVRRVFEAANKLRLAIVVHVRADATYGSDDAKVLLNHILPAAPDIPVQIAHLWGGGDYSGPALDVYADAVSAGDPQTRNLYFDVAELARVAGGSDEILQAAAMRIRKIGLDRILYGSDGPYFGNVPPRQAWRAFRTDLPLTDEEFRIIANNVAPYLR